MNQAARFFAGSLLPALALAGVLVLLEQTPLDEQVSGWFFDGNARAFPWRYNDFLEIVMHQWTKYLVALIAVAAIAGYALTFLMPQLQPARPLFLFASLALALAPFSVTVLKYFSMRHCPWSLDLYGGFAPHIGLFESYPGGYVAGRCFPAGHASTGFALFTFHFLGRALGNASLARAGFAAGMGAGLVLGLVRVMQGAHFLTHVLWAGVVCWSVVALLYAAVVGVREPTLPKRTPNPN
jgi:membrane-associated PAP2 superfamily phosphatase